MKVLCSVVLSRQLMVVVGKTKVVLCLLWHTLKSITLAVTLYLSAKKMKISLISIGSGSFLQMCLVWPASLYCQEGMARTRAGTMASCSDCAWSYTRCCALLSHCWWGSEQQIAVVVCGVLWPSWFKIVKLIICLIRRWWAGTHMLCMTCMRKCFC